MSYKSSFINFLSLRFTFCHNSVMGETTISQYIKHKQESLPSIHLLWLLIKIFLFDYYSNFKSGQLNMQGTLSVKVIVFSIKSLYYSNIY